MNFHLPNKIGRYSNGISKNYIEGFMGYPYPHHELQLPIVPKYQFPNTADTRWKCNFSTKSLFGVTKS